MVLAASTLGEVGEGLWGAEKEPMTSGPFVLKRSLSFTFSNPAYLGPAQSAKTFDDAVLNDATAYAYEAFERTLTRTPVQPRNPSKDPQTRPPQHPSRILGLPSLLTP
jgi:hypothetical protein